MRDVGVGLLLCVCLAVPAESPADETPISQIVVVIDTLRRDHLTFHGYPRPTSPALEKLAAESIVFENAMATSSWTKPSIASLLTGRYVAAHGADRGNPLPREVPVVAEVLARAGYETGGISGNPYISEAYGFERGFQHFRSEVGADVVPKPTMKPPRPPHDYPDIELLLREARDWLAERGDAPFFLYLQVMNVHGPYRAPPQFRERFLESPSRPLAFRDDRWMAAREKGHRESPVEITDDHLRDLRARYDGAISYTDQMLGAFVEELRESGVLDRSVLLVTSDHGEELFEHGGLGHQRTLHAEVLDVPLLVRLPRGKNGGRRVAAPVSGVDLAPTLLDLAGVDRAEGFEHGRSLRPYLEDPDAHLPARALQAVLHTSGDWFVLQAWPYRLFEIRKDYRKRRDVVELYDLVADPREVVDLSRRRADLLGKLQAIARSERERRAAAVATGPVELDTELEDRLRALGYLDP